jgi:hypothetical protein
VLTPTLSKHLETLLLRSPASGCSACEARIDEVELPCGSVSSLWVRAQRSSEGALRADVACAGFLRELPALRSNVAQGNLLCMLGQAPAIKSERDTGKCSTYPPAQRRRQAGLQARGPTRDPRHLPQITPANSPHDCVAVNRAGRKESNHLPGCTSAAQSSSTRGSTKLSSGNLGPNHAFNND